MNTGKHKLLIDNGMGPYLGPSGGHLPGHLRNLGVDPEEIDTIIISHAHADHVFGTLAPDGSQVFPNARYVIGEQEWAYWMKPNIKLGTLLPDRLKQLIVEGAKRHLGGIKERVEFVKHGQEVMTGITAVEVFGHTPGMLAFNISSGSESLFYSADALHHFALSIVHPEWHVGFDNDQELGARTRLRVLNQVIAERSLVLVALVNRLRSIAQRRYSLPAQLSPVGSHECSTPSAVRPAMVDERVLHPAQSANPPRTYRDQLSVSVLVIWHSSSCIPAEKCVRFARQESGAHSFGRLAAVVRGQCRPCREAANPAASQRANVLAPWQRVCG